MAAQWCSLLQLVIAASYGMRAKTGRIDSELIARFMAFKPEAGRRKTSIFVTASSPPRALTLAIIEKAHLWTN